MSRLPRSPASLNATYYPARDRIRRCQSVAVMPWPHDTAVRDDTSLVAVTGFHEPDRALFLVPWRWEESDGQVSGRFLYDMLWTKMPLRWELDDLYPTTGDAFTGGVRTVTWGGTPAAPERRFLLWHEVNPSAAGDVPDLLLIEPGSVCWTSAPSTTPFGSLAMTPYFLPRDGDGLLSGLPASPAFRMQDLVEHGDRIYGLGDDPDAETWWLIVLEKRTQAGTATPFVVLDLLQLNTLYATSEYQRLKISPDGRWLAAAFGTAEAGVLLLHVPEVQGSLGAPEVVAGLRAGGVLFQRWTKDTADVWKDVVESYGKSERGQDGMTRAPVWPLPEDPIEATSLAQLPERAVGFDGGEVAFNEIDGVLFLSMNTDPLTIWRVQPGLLETGEGAPWLFVGAFPSDGAYRQRLAWTTREGTFHLGDTGLFAWSSCEPEAINPFCPVEPK